MKKTLGMFSIAALLAGMLLVGGCGGSGDSVLPPGAGPVIPPPPVEEGFAIKGPVIGATVRYSDDTTAVTGIDGNFPYKATLSVRTTGGTYRDANNLLRQSPDMSAPPGMRNVTPLTTLYNNASPEDRVKLVALLGTASIDTKVV